jgi:hypothetical protein
MVLIGGRMPRCSADWSVTSKADRTFNCSGISTSGWYASEDAEKKIVKLEQKLKRKRPDDLEISVMSRDD